MSIQTLKQFSRYTAGRARVLACYQFQSVTTNSKSPQVNHGCWSGTFLIPSGLDDEQQQNTTTR